MTIAHDARPALVFVCGHLCDERLFAAQVAELSATHACSVFVSREQDSLGGMADALLRESPPAFVLIGLSMGGYVAFEVLRRAPERLRGLVLLDTRATADTPAGRAARRADFEQAKAHGMPAFARGLPARWLAPANARDTALSELVCAMAVAVGHTGQGKQQAAMQARPDSLPDLAQVNVPTLVACGRQDLVTPLAAHEEIAARMPGARLEVIEDSGHLCTIEQPAAVTALLKRWLSSLPSGHVLA